jgi:hypothetical protein
MPIDDFRRQLAGQNIAIDIYDVSLTAAILKWLEFTGERAVLVIARDGFHSVVTVQRARTQVWRLLPYAESRVSASRDVGSVWAIRNARKREAVGLPPGV